MNQKALAKSAVFRDHKKTHFSLHLDADELYDVSRIVWLSIFYIRLEFSNTPRSESKENRYAAGATLQRRCSPQVAVREAAVDKEPEARRLRSSGG